VKLGKLAEGLTGPGSIKNLGSLTFRIFSRKRNQNV
jgi:hypothetical protein